MGSNPATPTSSTRDLLAGCRPSGRAGGRRWRFLEEHAAALENLEVTGATMRFLVPATPAEVAHRRDVLARAVGDPAARAQVDSGRLAEPFGYVDSPLTTPDPRRAFPGRPDIVRLRQLARAGITVLVEDAAEPPNLPGGGDLPVAVHCIRDLDPGPTVLPEAPAAGHRSLGEVLGARPDEIWVLRPDAHIAAVLTRAADVAPAVARVLACPQQDPLTEVPRWRSTGGWAVSRPSGTPSTAVPTGGCTPRN